MSINVLITVPSILTVTPFLPVLASHLLQLVYYDVLYLLGTAGILQLCNEARHNVVIIYVPIYHPFY